ncbi:hypothetical protein [Sphingomonas koreensis]
MIGPASGPAASVGADPGMQELIIRVAYALPAVIAGALGFLVLGVGRRTNATGPSVAVGRVNPTR